MKPMPPVEPAARPGLKLAIQVARASAHGFLVFGAMGMLVGISAQNGSGVFIAAGSVAGFLLSYFTWVGLVLFGCMNFSLLTMLGFVLALGTCIGLLTSGADLMILLGGGGLLLLAFVAIIPISRYDPTAHKRRQTDF